jgi:hypothetical protein
MTTILKELKMVKATLYSSIVSIMLLLPGCGGGGTGNAVPLPMNTAIVLSATLAPGLTKTSLPIKGIDVTFVLPQTASPILNSDGSLQIGETGLKNLNQNGNIQSGSYVPATRTVHFILLPNDIALTDLGTGDIARLTCDISSGAQLSAQDIHPVYKISGPGSVDISGEIVPSVSIVTYQKP